MADEFNSLAQTGVWVRDLNSSNPDDRICARAFLLAFASDYRGIEHALEIRGAPTADHPCYKCTIKAVQSKHKKMCANHYMQLHLDDPQRDELCPMFNPEGEERTGQELPPAARTHAMLLAKTTVFTADPEPSDEWVAA